MITTGKSPCYFVRRLANIVVHQLVSQNTDSSPQMMLHSVYLMCAQCQCKWMLAAGSLAIGACAPLVLGGLSHGASALGKHCSVVSDVELSGRTAKLID